MILVAWVAFVWAAGVAIIAGVTIVASEKRLDVRAVYEAALWPIVAAGLFSGGAAGVMTGMLAKWGLLAAPLQRKLDAVMLRHMDKALRRTDYELVALRSQHAAERACELLVEFNVRARIEASGDPERPHAIVWTDQDQDVSSAQPFLLGYARGFEDTAHESMRRLARIAAAPMEGTEEEHAGAQRVLTDVLAVLAYVYGMKELNEHLAERSKQYGRYFEGFEAEAAAAKVAVERDKC